MDRGVPWPIGVNIVFDFDGTLVDCSERHHRAYCASVDDLGGRPLSKDRYWIMKRSDVALADVLRASLLCDEHRAAFLERFVDYVERKSLVALDTLFPGVATVLSHLAPHRLYLATMRKRAQELVDQLVELGIDGAFSGTVTAGDLPVEETLKEALVDTFDLHGPSLIVGDTESDIAAGKRRSMATIAATYGIRERSILLACSPDRAIDTITELPGAIDELTFSSGL